MQPELGEKRHFEVPRQARLPSPIRFIPTKKKKAAKNAGVVQGVPRVTTNTTDDVVSALERYVGDGDGDGTTPTPLTPLDSPRAALKSSLHAQHHPSLLPPGTDRLFEAQ